MDDYADDVAALIGALRIERYTLVGHSMGGKIALALAARRPAGLASLVLLAPSPPTPEPIAGAERARLLAGHGDRAAAEKTAGAITARPLAAPVFALVVEDNLRTSPPAWRAWLERGSREDISALMSRIAVPVLVVTGTADPVIPADLLEREVVRRIAGARLVMVPDVGHLVPLEGPEAAARAIRGARPGSRGLPKRTGPITSRRRDRPGRAPRGQGTEHDHSNAVSAAPAVREETGSSMPFLS